MRRLFFVLLSICSFGCNSNDTWLRMLNSSGRHLENLEIAFLKKEQVQDAEKRKIAELANSSFKWRFNHWLNGNDPSYGTLAEVPTNVLIQWNDQDGNFFSKTVHVPEDVATYLRKNRTNKMKKRLTFELTSDGVVLVYVFLRDAPGKKPIYYPLKYEEREEFRLEGIETMKRWRRQKSQSKQKERSEPS